MSVVLRVYEWGDSRPADHHCHVVYGRVAAEYPGCGRFLYVEYRADCVAKFQEFKRLWGSLPRRATMCKPDLDDEEDD